MKYILNIRLLAHPFGINFAGRVLSDVEFADDVALVCENDADIKTAPETLASAAEKFGLYVNETKTKILHVDKTPCSPLTTIEVCIEHIEIVKQSTYLSLIVCSNGYQDAEISAKVAKANTVLVVF